MVKLRVHKLSDNAKLPEYAHDDDSGFDLFSTQDIVIPSLGQTTAEFVSLLATQNFEDSDFKDANSAYDYLEVPYVTIYTDLTFEIPEGYEIQIRSKSGLAAKSGIFVLNSPATIDEGYRGNLGICLANISNSEYMVEKGQKIAQGVLVPITRAKIIDMGMGRGTGGFGSTGLNTKVESSTGSTEFKLKEYSKQEALAWLDDLNQHLDNEPNTKTLSENPSLSEIEEFQRNILESMKGSEPIVESSIEVKEEVRKTIPYPQEKSLIDTDPSGKYGYININQLD